MNVCTTCSVKMRLGDAVRILSQDESLGKRGVITKIGDGLHNVALQHGGKTLAFMQEELEVTHSADRKSQRHKQIDSRQPDLAHGSDT